MYKVVKEVQFSAPFEFNIEAAYNPVSGPAIAVICRTSGPAVNAFQYGVIMNGEFKTERMDSQRSKMLKLFHDEMAAHLRHFGAL